MTTEEISKALKICARTSPCPKDCPRYYVGKNGAECARVIMEDAAAKLDELAAQLEESQRKEKAAVEDISKKCSTCGKRIGWNTCKEASFISDGEVCLNWQWRGADDGEGSK